MKICPNDNLQFSDVMKFCPQCGNKLREMDEKKDRIVGGNYRLGDELGEGWTGKVFHATHIMMGKEVALKAIACEEELSDAQVQAFREWARDVANLNHRHICIIHDVWLTDRKIIYLASELIRGRNLRDLLNERGHISAKAFLTIIRQVCQALSYAHGLHIIHGDLKPENVMLTKVEGRDVQVKVMDFGMARLALLTGDSKFRYSSGMYDVVGMPEYVSPEQIKGHELDARSDVYLLGLLMYEMITGSRPFRSSSIEELYEAQLRETPTAPRDLKPRLNIPKFIERAILKALEKNRRKRQQSVEEVLDELDAEVGLDEQETSTGELDLGVSPKFWRKMKSIVRGPKTKISQEGEEAPEEKEEEKKAQAAASAGKEENASAVVAREGKAPGSPEGEEAEPEIPVEPVPLEKVDLKLTLVREGREWASYTVNSLPLTIGRSKSADIRIKDDISISRRHATIFLKDGDIIIMDRNSSNGVVCNGKRAKIKKLENGDSVTLGNIEIRVELKQK